MCEEKSDERDEICIYLTTTFRCPNITDAEIQQCAIIKCSEGNIYLFPESLKRKLQANYAEAMEGVTIEVSDE